jgi:hypothetical protein
MKKWMPRVIALAALSAGTLFARDIAGTIRRKLFHVVEEGPAGVIPLHYS